jgi:SAM-dependent methyltransferase
MRDSSSQSIGTDPLPPVAVRAREGRLGHASLDLSSRNAKARKIETLLDLGAKQQTIRLLEVGTGAGGIAHYFGTHARLRCDVTAVDVEDCRQVRDGYRFVQVAGVQLPFADCSFDAVISNHVIEHVGDAEAQSMHLRELRRVLDAGGIGYLAVPNRWQIVEPHYGLAFLSWLPAAWRSPYVRFRGRGAFYDCRPLTVAELEPKLEASGFDFAQLHGRALRATFEIERPHAFAYRHVFRRISDAWFARVRAIFPTLIYSLQPRGAPPGGDDRGCT